MFKVVETPVLTCRGGVEGPENAFWYGERLGVCLAFIQHYWGITPKKLTLRLSPRPSRESVAITLIREEKSWEGAAWEGVLWKPTEGRFPKALVHWRSVYSDADVWLRRKGVAPKPGNSVTVHITLFVVE